MATYTSNYGWTKPSGSDNVDISVLNNNLDDQDSTIHDAFLNMAPPFSESSTYAVDDIVLYGTGLYKCHTAVVTPGSWTGSTNWQVYKLSEGGSGTTDYDDLDNKPSINDVTLSGNKTTRDLGLQSELTFDNVPTANSTNPVKSGGIYDALTLKADKTTTATGEMLSLVPTSEGRALIHTAYGMSVQNGTPTPSSPVDIESAKANFISTDGNNTQNLTTNLTLRAIEVSSTDNYNLVRDNKYYIADTLDYSEDNGFVVTRRIGEKIYDGSEDEDWRKDSEQYGNGKFIGVPEANQWTTVNVAYTAFMYNLSDIKLSRSDYYATPFVIPAFAMFKSNSLNMQGLAIRTADTDAMDITQFKTWLSTNNIQLDYVLATPTTENITTEQALALLGLKTYDESTTISSQAEPACTVAVEYAKERLGALALTAYNTAKGNDLRITALEA